jgi:hypothetical protein
MWECIFYIGTIEAEDRATREKAFGYETYCPDSGVDPADYADWDVSGALMLVYDLAGVPLAFITSLADELGRAGAASVLVFDRHGKYEAVTLWVIGSYVYDAFRIFPKLCLSSPEKRCGKTTLLETIAAVVSRSLMASNMSPVVIFRAVKLLQILHNARASE